MLFDVPEIVVGRKHESRYDDIKIERNEQIETSGSCLPFMICWASLCLYLYFL